MGWRDMEKSDFLNRLLEPTKIYVKDIKKLTMCRDKIDPLTGAILIDPTTGWFNIVEILNKTSELVGKILKSVWLSRYLLPNKLILLRQMLQMLPLNDNNMLEIIRNMK